MENTITSNEPPPISNVMLSDVLPIWMDNCPLIEGWCRYNGKIYFASINFEESEKAQKPIFDLAYCATKAFNDIYLFRREWDKKKFCRWAKHPSW